MQFVRNTTNVYCQKLSLKFESSQQMICSAMVHFKNSLLCQLLRLKIRGTGSIGINLAFDCGC